MKSHRRMRLRGTFPHNLVEFAASRAYSWEQTASSHCTGCRMNGSAIAAVTPDGSSIGIKNHGQIQKLSAILLVNCRGSPSRRGQGWETVAIEHGLIIEILLGSDVSCYSRSLSKVGLSYYSSTRSRITLTTSKGVVITPGPRHHHFGIGR